MWLDGLSGSDTLASQSQLCTVRLHVENPDTQLSLSNYVPFDAIPHAVYTLHVRTAVILLSFLFYSLHLFPTTLPLSSIFQSLLPLFSSSIPISPPIHSNLSFHPFTISHTSLRVHQLSWDLCFEGKRTSLVSSCLIKARRCDPTPPPSLLVLHSHPLFIQLH